MKTNRILLFVIAIVLVLPACAPAATPTAAPIAVQPMAPYPTQAPAYADTAAPAAPAERPYPTSAPAATQDSSWMAPAATATAISPWSGPQPTMAPGPADNEFRDYGVNPYVDPRQDHLSTFGLDVDTASYTVTRRYINDGSLPPFEAVRAEEFVNYFKQGYSNPDGAAFAIFADGSPSPFGQANTYFLRVGIQGYQVPDSERKPVNLTFVIDISGSMNMENRLGLVKRSLQLLVDRLRAQDSVAIVAYGTNAHVVLDPTRGDRRNTILNAIYSLETEGSTNAEAGLNLGYQLAMQVYRSDSVNRVILCTDGMANTGETSPDALLKRISGYVDEGITLTSLGFGMGNFNDVLLEQLADRGNGSYAYIDTIEQAHKMFVDDLTGTLQIIARDARAQVDFNQDIVAGYRLIGYENRAISDQDFRKDNRQVRQQAGEVGAGHNVTVLYALQLVPGAEGRLATVQMRWNDPDTAQNHEINGNVNTWNLSQKFADTAPRFQLAVAAGEFAEILRESPWVDGNTLRILPRLALQTARMMPDDPDVMEFSNLVQKAMQMKNVDW